MPQRVPNCRWNSPSTRCVTKCGPQPGSFHSSIPLEKQQRPSDSRTRLPEQGIKTMTATNHGLFSASPDASKRHRLRKAVALAGALLAMGSIPVTCFAQGKTASSGCPPAARNDGTKEMIHGVSVADPYRWLEDQNS